MTYAETVKFLIAMIIMMNPLGSLSIFLQLTHRFPVLHQRKTAITCGITITVIMVLSLWVGAQLLDLMGITIASFRFAGGIILLLVGLSMLQSQKAPSTIRKMMPPPNTATPSPSSPPAIHHRSAQALSAF